MKLEGVERDIYLIIRILDPKNWSGPRQMCYLSNFHFMERKKSWQAGNHSPAAW